MTQPAERSMVIVVSCNERYAFLLRGLILSLAELGIPRQGVRLALIDIGCSLEMTAWLAARGVEVVPFPASLIPKIVMDVVKPWQWGQVLRPWIPAIIPEAETIVWVDADIWFQSAEFIDLIADALEARPDGIVAAPGMSHYGTLLYENIEFLRTMQLHWYRACCQDDFASAMANRLHFSSGLFAMRRGNPIWDEWKRQIEAIYPSALANDPSTLHLAEQTALNVILLMNPQVTIRLDPIFNFHCNGGGAFRDHDGKVRTSLMIPHREIGTVHLANWSLLKERYIQEGLLYQRGDYLSHSEWAQIRASDPS